MNNKHLIFLLMFITIKGYAQEPNISVEKTIWNVRLNEPYFYLTLNHFLFGQQQ